jgi:hypothetical protein
MLFIFNDIYVVIGFFLFFTFLSRFVSASNKTIAIREFMIVLYGVNYIISPYLTYRNSAKQTSVFEYGMKIPEDFYFEIIVPGYLALIFGLFVFKIRAVKPNVGRIALAVKNNIQLVKSTFFIGLSCLFIYTNFSGSLNFVLYFISLFRYLSVFALIVFDKKKYLVWFVLVVIIDVFISLRSFMFHDLLLWCIFFSIFFVYAFNISLKLKTIGLSIGIVVVLFVQQFKVNYRENITPDLSVLDIVSNVLEDGVAAEGDVESTINRTNQAWIFASTIDRMDRVKDFQGFNLLLIYLRSALLPRFIAQDKITSGDKEIFNKFSGHNISAGTSMGLGVFADGYIGFGFLGVVFFGFFFGLLISFILFVIGNWMRINEIYSFTIFPLLFYAIRPDCETQTLLNHLTKGLVLLTCFQILTKYKYSGNSRVAFKSETGVN